MVVDINATRNNSAAPECGLPKKYAFRQNCAGPGRGQYFKKCPARCVGIKSRKVCVAEIVRSFMVAAKAISHGRSSDSISC